MVGLKDTSVTKHSHPSAEETLLQPTSPTPFPPTPGNITVLKSFPKALPPPTTGLNDFSLI